MLLQAILREYKSKLKWKIMKYTPTARQFDLIFIIPISHTESHRHFNCKLFTGKGIILEFTWKEQGNPQRNLS